MLVDPNSKLLGSKLHTTNTNAQLCMQLGIFFALPAHPPGFLRKPADFDLSGSHRTMIESGSAHFCRKKCLEFRLFRIYNVETF